MRTNPHARGDAPMRAPHRSLRRTKRIALVALVACLSAPASAALAQPARTTLTTSGLPLLVTGTTGADLEAGFVLLGSSSFTVEASGKAKDFPRTATVQVSCGAPCPAAGTAAVNSLQWRRDDQVTWTSLSTSFTTVETSSFATSGTTARTLFWRYVLDWTSAPPTANTQFLIDFQLVVTSP